VTFTHGNKDSIPRPTWLRPFAFPSGRACLYEVTGWTCCVSSPGG
jgi:hypothetical protein